MLRHFVPGRLVQGLIERLFTQLNADGGLGWWFLGDSWPLLTLHAAHALARAMMKGYTVNPAQLRPVQNYLKYASLLLSSRFVVELCGLT